jgi:ubiquinone/menaquinone biosynthesis C-methylase UbiE
VTPIIASFLPHDIIASWPIVFVPGGSVTCWRVLFAAGWDKIPQRFFPLNVREAMTVLEPGPGMGFFTIPLARLVGPSGRVIAVDLQAKMIESMKGRASQAGVLDRIDARGTSAETMGVSDLEGRVDFTLAFAMVHELPDARHFFAEVSRASKQNARVLLAEPRGHVRDEAFATELAVAAATGLRVGGRPAIKRSQAALLFKK